MKPNRKNPILLASLTFALTLAAPSAFAADLYWDTDGATTPSGSWATSGTTWSTDSTGATAVTGLTTTGLDHLFFSAGTDATGSYGVSLSSDQSARSLTFEEGAATLTGSTLTLAGGGGITVLAGSGDPTISSNLTVNGNNIFNVGAGRFLTLNTGTFTRGTRATVNIQGAGNGSSTMTGLDVNVRSIIGPWASVTAGGTTTYARITDLIGTIGGLGYTGSADGTAVTAAGSVNSTTSNINYSLSIASGTQSALAASASVNTLRFASAPGNYTLVVNTAFTTRGIMNVSGRQLDINSNGVTVKAGTTSAAEMVVNAVSGNIRFVGNGSFNGNIIKTGSAELIFGAAANFSGISAITVNEGILATSAGTDNTLVGATINSGGTLRWSTSNKHRDDAVFTVNAGGTLDTAAITDTIGNVTGAGLWTANGGDKTLSAASGTFSGDITGTLTTLAINSSSTYTLSGNNTFTGATSVAAGTLYVTGALSNSAVSVEAAGTIGGDGTLGGTLNIAAGGNLDLTGATLGAVSSGILSLTGTTLTLGNLTFQDLDGWTWLDAAPGTYKLIDGGFTVDFGSTAFTNADNAYVFGNGNKGYFTSGSLNAVIVAIPEPNAAALLGGFGLLALLRRRRKC